MINNWAQQGGDLGVRLPFKLITGETACDAGDEVCNLYAWLSAGIDEPDIGQLAAGMACGVSSRDVDNAFGGSMRTVRRVQRRSSGRKSPNGG